MIAHQCRKSEGGFTLIEALIALVVVAFGMLSLAGFQVTMSRNSDVAKQRTEATRLAQEKVEELRAYISTTAVAAFDWTDLPAGGATQTDAPATTTNTTYTRSWVLDDTSIAPVATTPGYAALQRTIQVSVTWADRGGEPQTVTLNSVISKTNPSDIGGLNMPTIEGGVLRRPKGRDINIPVPAIKLGGANSGKSKVAFGSDTLVFSDTTGDVVYVCSNQSVNSIVDNTDLTTSCTATTAYLLVGFISAQSVSLPAATNLRARFVAGTKPNGGAMAIDMTGTPKCGYADAVDQNNSNSVIAGYRAYVCLVFPTNHSVPLPPATTPPGGKHWSAKVELTTNNATSVSAQVCRYGYTPATTDSTVDNSRHPPTYMYVTESLDNQNYVLTNNGSCPTGAVVQQTTLPAGCTSGQLVNGFCPP